MKFISFGHAGDGNVHSSILRGELSDNEWESKKHTVITKLYNYVSNVGGLPPAEHVLVSLKNLTLSKL